MAVVKKASQGVIGIIFSSPVIASYDTEARCSKSLICTWIYQDKRTSSRLANKPRAGINIKACQ